MRYAVLIVALLGSCGSALLGMKWLSDLSTGRAQIDKMIDDQAALAKVPREKYLEMIEKVSEGAPGGSMKENRAKIDRLGKAAYILLAAAFFSFIGAALTTFHVVPGTVGGGIILLSSLASAAFEPKTLLTVFFLLVAGGLAFLVRRPKPTSVEA